MGRRHARREDRGPGSGIVILALTVCIEQMT